MALTPSQRPTREWLLLVLAFGLIAAVCVPLWQWSGQSEAQAGFFEKFRSPERLRRQRRAFHQEILPTDEGARVLPEDARPMLRKIDQITTRRGPSILATMARMALGKFAVSRSATDASEVVRTQADV